MDSMPILRIWTSRRNSFSLACVAAILIFSLSNEAKGDGKETIRRFALVAGSNDGGPKRPILRYAHNDAKAIARVLQQLGGVSRGDSVVLIEPDRFDFEAGLAKIRDRLKRSKASGLRLEVLFYYSGHSDEQGLMLGEDVITYKELREAIAELPADVRIAVLDSCSSGVLTRTKGGTRQPPFLMDTSVDVKGYAYLTSSSADESAQESDKVGGSFFTHYFVSGLRGAADTSKDSKVTLNEAYQYAFDETLARTESTQAGPQHPSYDFQLKGSGDLVLTDLRGTSAALEFPPDLKGRIFIRNKKGQLVAEINKHAGTPILLGLESGIYEVSLEDGKALYKGTITLRGGTRTAFNSSRFEPINPEQTVARGGVLDDAPLEEKKEPDDIIRRPLRAAFAPGLSTDMGVEGKVENNFSINFIGLGNYLNGGELGAIGNIRTESVEGFQGAGIFNMANGEVRGFQGAGIFNLSRGAVAGFQQSGIFNFVYGPFLGFQSAGIANINGLGSARGFQGAGIFNFNRTASDGFQGAGIININGGYIKGFQGAGIANVSGSGESNGAQVAGISNYAYSIKGAQIAGIINTSCGLVHGMQLGLINYAVKSEGVQIGLVNISKESSGAPIGLVNAVGNGMFAPVIWASYNSLINVGIKAGSKHVYSIIGYGNHPIGGRSDRRDSLILGLGGHLDFDPIWFELDLTTHWIHQDYNWASGDLNLLSKLRLSFGWRFSDYASLFAGPTVGAHYSNSVRVDDIYTAWETTDGDIHTSIGLGFLAGLQFEPKIGKLNSH